MSFSLFPFQTRAADQIASRYLALASDQRRPMEHANWPTPFYQALAALPGSGKTPILADALAQIRTHSAKTSAATTKASENGGPMRSDIRDAIESARTVDVYRPMIHGVDPQRNRSPELIRAIVLAVVHELDDDMTMAELRDELEIAANQAAQR